MLGRDHAFESELSEGAMANKKVQKAGKAAQSARSNPYVQKLVEDEELRQNIISAFESARDAYGRLNNGKSPAKQIFDDKKLQKHIRETAGSVRDVSVALHEAPRKRKRSGGGGFGRVLLLGVVGGAVALALSEGLRKKVLDALFGAEEEFEYTSTTSSPSSTPAGTAAERKLAERAPIGRPLAFRRLLSHGRLR